MSACCWRPEIGIGNATQAEGWELQAIASSVIGGTSLFGAVGSVHGPLLGSFILTTINNGANLLNVNSFWQRVVTGVLIIVIVDFDGLRQRRTDRHRQDRAGWRPPTSRLRNPGYEGNVEATSAAMRSG